MDFVLIARTPIVELLETGGSKAVEAKMLEIFRKASLTRPRGRAAAVLVRRSLRQRATRSGRSWSGAIRGYQVVHLARAARRSCKYYPSCSQYALDA